MKISFSLCSTIIVFLLFSSPNGYTQPGVFGKIKYVSFIDSAALQRNLEQLKEENPRQYATMAQLSQELVRISANLNFELSFAANEAFSAMETEAAAFAKANSDLLAHQAVVTMFDGDKKYYTNSADKIRLFEYSLGKAANFVHVNEPFDKFSWTLTNETKSIGKYNCQKATGYYTIDTHCCGLEKISVVAWFPPDFPFPYGPMGFDGLPGLILEVVIEHKTHRGFRATAIDIQTKNDSQIQSKMHEPIRVMTEKEFSEYAAQRTQRLKQRQ